MDLLYAYSLASSPDLQLYPARAAAWRALVTPHLRLVRVLILSKDHGRRKVGWRGTRINPDLTHNSSMKRGLSPKMRPISGAEA